MNEIAFELSKEDFVDFQIYYSKTSKAGKDQKKRTQLVLAILYLLSIAAFIISFSGWARVFSVGIIVIFGAFQLLTYEKRQEKRITRYVGKMVDASSPKGTLGQKKVTLYEDHLLLAEEGGESKLHYGAQMKILESEKNYFIFRDEISAIIIPKKAFPNPAAEKQFMDFLRGKLLP